MPEQSSLGEGCLDPAMVHQKENLKFWAILFLFISVVAAILSVVLIIGLAAIIVRIVFVLFSILFVTFWVRHYLHQHRK
jgi:uncharacterized membrane protein YtjA (UPF0391 family)